MADDRFWVLGVALVTGLAIAAASPWLVRRWRRLRPMARCLILSVLAHIGLLSLLTGWRRPDLPPAGPGRIRLVVSASASWRAFDQADPAAANPEEPPAEPAPQEPPLPLPSPAPPAEPEPEPESAVEPPAASPEPDDRPPEVDRPAPDALPESAPAEEGAAPRLADPVQLPPGEDHPAVVAPVVASPPEDVGPPVTPPAPAPAASPLYRARTAPDRLARVVDYGGDERTEAAVQAALAWLARVQWTDGRWDPAQFGGGRAADEPGAGRFQAGLHAQTGITGLALLAFLAAGSTHQSGPYQPTVARGVDFLVSQQASDGCLSGRQAGHVEAMYCHGMALLALSEAYGMTEDRRLEGPLLRAVAYTRSMQHPSTGGWRYRRGDLGDTSQLGWQLMSLFSASQSGIAVGQDVLQRAGVFLDHVSSGRARGLASYQFGQAPSRPMTAEALLCRLVLGRCSGEQAREAAGYVLQELPGSGGQPNFYYWYYASLALYQLQGPEWETWNAAMKATLLELQRKAGPLAGSWDPECRWGPYGGRIYSTALATLSLEVYYRYLPFSNRLAHWTARQPLRR